MIGRRGLLATIAAGFLVAGCESPDIERFNPFKNLSLPDLGLPRSDGGAYAATDLLPEMAFGRDDRPDVDTALGGYVGPLDKPDGPIALMPAAVGDFVMSVRVSGSRNDYSLQGLGGTVRVGDDVLWDLSVVTFQDRHRRLSALRPPLVTGRMTTTETGAVRGVVLDFPALRQRGGAIPARGDAEYETLADSLRYLAAPLPSGAAAVGDNLGLPAAVQGILARTSADIERNDMQARVAGITRYGDRPALVSVYDGDILLADRTNRMVLRIAGHAIYDIATGLALRSVLRLTWHGRADDIATDARVFIETAITPRRQPA